jgi:exonuclease SbcD
MKIAHTADTHLDYKQYGMKERGQDLVAAVANVFEWAGKNDADAVTLGGDQFHTVRPSADSVAVLAMLVRNANSKGIKVFGIDGNHDASNSSWLKVCGILPLENWVDEQTPEVSVIEAKDGSESLKVFGINSCSPQIFTAKLATLAKHHKDNNLKLDALYIHMPLSDIWGMDIDRGVTAMDIAKVVADIGVKLVMMGDIHDFREVSINGVRFIYPGSPEVTASDEDENKVFSIVDVNGGEISTSMEASIIRPIFRADVETDKEVEELPRLLAEFKAASPIKPVAIVTYDSELKNMAKRAQALLGENALVRVRPMTKAGVDNMIDKLREAQFDRSSALHSLDDVLKESFDSDSDEYDLITGMLAAPDRVIELSENYVKTRGIEL